jgi:hypothetical protein
MPKMWVHKDWICSPRVYVQHCSSSRVSIASLRRVSPLKAGVPHSAVQTRCDQRQPSENTHTRHSAELARLSVLRESRFTSITQALVRPFFEALKDGALQAMPPAISQQLYSPRQRHGREIEIDVAHQGPRESSAGMVTQVSADPGNSKMDEEPRIHFSFPRRARLDHLSVHIQPAIGVTAGLTTACLGERYRDA